MSTETYMDLTFRLVESHGEPAAAHRILLRETLTVTFTTCWLVTSTSGPWIGRGETHTDAVLDWLRGRLGIDESDLTA